MVKIPIRRLKTTEKAMEVVNWKEIVNVMKTVIEKHGLPAPIVVCPTRDEFEVVSGNAVLEAWIALNMGEAIPCEVVEPQPIQASNIAVYSDTNGNPRLERLSALKASIRRDGLLVPVTVRPSGGRYSLIDGLRRIVVWKEIFPEIPISAVILTR